MDIDVGQMNKQIFGNKYVQYVKRRSGKN